MESHYRIAEGHSAGIDMYTSNISRDLVWEYKSKLPYINDLGFKLDASITSGKVDALEIDGINMQLH